MDTGESVRYRSGEEAQIVCDEGYALRQVASKAKVICKEDGSWESAEQVEFPECRGKIH